MWAARRAGRAARISPLLRAPCTDRSCCAALRTACFDLDRSALRIGDQPFAHKANADLCYAVDVVAMVPPWHGEALRTGARAELGDRASLGIDHRAGCRSRAGIEH